MTGFGCAQCDVEGFHINVEAKAVNGRFLKTTVKLPSFLAAQESMLEGCMKARLRRGSVTLSVFVSRINHQETLVQVNEAVVRAYQTIFTRCGLPHDAIPTLPGVIGYPDRDDDSPPVRDALQACAEEALIRLDDMRRHEGEGLGAVLRDLCDNIETLRQRVRTRAPAVAAEYHQKLQMRLSTLLAGVDVPVDSATLAREVALFADRSDITEEVERLGVHLGHVRSHLEQGGEVGRTLEFLAQEMHREVNTMGSKSADSELSQWVVALKTELERFKEQVANVQ